MWGVLFKCKKQAKAYHETLGKEIADYGVISFFLFYIKLMFGDPTVSHISDR
jgi:hypothetical protein